MILIAEDDEQFGRLYCRALSLNGYEAKCFTTGYELLDELKNTSPTLLILDLGLPGIDGFEVASRARQMGYTGPMIAVSGAITKMTKDQLEPHGFSILMPKPLPLVDLIREVAEATGQQPVIPGKTES